MFSSIPSEGRDEDEFSTILTRGKGKLTGNKFEGDFPVDCLGCILLFVRDVEIFHNMFHLSKKVNHFILEGGPWCCKNIKFTMYSPLPKEKLFPFVHHLIASETVTPRTVFTNDSIKSFPNLEKLSIIQNKNVDWNLFKNTPNLIHLEIEDCELMRGKGSFFVSNKIREFKFDNSHINSQKQLNDSTNLFLELGNLERLELSYVEFKETNYSDFKNLRKLVVLKLRCVRLTDELFEYTPNVEELELKYSDNVKPAGFKFLKKLDVCEVEDCIHIDYGSRIRNVMEKDWDPKVLHVKDSTDLAGDIPPEIPFEFEELDD